MSFLFFVLCYLLIGFGVVGIGYTLYGDPIDPIITVLGILGWPILIIIVMSTFLIMFINNGMRFYVEWLNKRFFGQSNL
jgi:hypothetical protein